MDEGRPFDRQFKNAGSDGATPGGRTVGPTLKKEILSDTTSSLWACIQEIPVCVLPCPLRLRFIRSDLNTVQMVRITRERSENERRKSPRLHFVEQLVGGVGSAYCSHLEIDHVGCGRRVFVMRSGSIGR